MKNFTALLIVFWYILGCVVAKGFWMTLFSIFIPPVALVVAVVWLVERVS